MRGERWHGRRERMLLPCVLSTLALLSAIHGSRGSATSPVTSHVIFPSGSFPVISPAPHEANNTSDTTHAPLPSQPGSSPTICPMVHEVKNPSNTTPAPLTPLPHTFPVVSPAPHEVEGPSSNATHAPWASQPVPSPTINLVPPKAMNASNPIQAPLTSQPVPSPTINLVPPKAMNPSNAIQAPLASQPVPSPTINLVPPKVMNPSNTIQAPLASQPVPSPTINLVPPKVMNPSNATKAPSSSHPAPSPAISPSTPDVNSPSNATQAPSTSHLAPSPVISPAPHDFKNHSNATQAPSNSHPAPSPKISPMSHDVKNHSNATQAPSTSHLALSPKISPALHDVKNHSNATRAPSTSHPAPFPKISPAPHDVKNHSNATQAPSTSHLAPSPEISPAPHDVKNHSNAIQAPSTSHPAPSPKISPAPHDVKNHSNATQVPSTSHPAPSPVMSPAPHDVKNPSNATQAPSTSHPTPSPEVSPAPHDSKNPSNATQAPSTSHPAPSPVISPAPHDVKNPPNATQAPSTSHPAPSPVISSAPHDVKNHSNTTQAPSTSHPAPSPEISPTPQGVKNHSIATQTPSTLHHAPSPEISPTPHDVKNHSNATQAPLTSHPAPSPIRIHAPHDVKNSSNATQAPSTLHPAPSPHDFKNPSNTAQAPSSSHPAPPMISPTPYDVKNPSNSTLAPLTSHLTPSPMMSPAPHEAKNPSKTPHAPLSSHHGSSPAISPSLHKAKNPPYTTHAPLNLHPQPPDGRILHSPASSPAIPISLPPLSSHNQVEGPMISPAPLQPPVLPNDRQTRQAPPFYVQGPSLSPIQAPFYSTDEGGAPTFTSSTGPIPSPSASFSRPIHSPTLSPSASLSRKPRAPSAPHVLVLPPPPPNSDCNSLTCSAPLTNTPPGAPCACVLPIKVGLRLGVALYTFFPLVSELAQEIAAGIFVKQSQVRIMGANAASNEPEKTVVLLNLVPLGRYFDNTTAFFIYERFWHKQVAIQASYFGDYDVLYVLYPGLPSSPPTAPADINVDDGAYGNTNNARAIHPLGVDVTKRKEKLSGSLIAIIVLSSVIAMVFIIGAIWFLLLKHRSRACLPPPTSQTLLPTFAKSLATGARPTILGSGPSSTSASFSSSIATYAGSGKTFSLMEMEMATNRFDDSRIIGEGGFGRVYQGTLEDGTQVAVKVLKRDDQQGGREFLAEVEMLSRLHHRNLVKLIGICTEDVRCLVYELIPNGSVESHLHGVNKETTPLDWNARVKIALGAARGLAYLHEDSSPCVIHRDFKSSNILLEHDFTPKVSDFGLARTAVDEGNEHISTRVMGTFGYVAPEYAMTGHLLVKSDVYSYGVVLLELLTGRKPVDMSQPPGQENLVTWARPLLTSLDGLEMIIDPALGVDVQFDSVTKVAAIASMCVQPEVTHRPFMGEVVQALRLVCNESDEHNRASVSCSQEELSGPDTDIRISMGLGLEAERALSASDIFSTSARFTMEASRSSRRHSSSGPLTTARSRQFWRRVRGLSGSMSEHGFTSRFVADLDAHERWP